MLHKRESFVAVTYNNHSTRLVSRRFLHSICRAIVKVRQSISQRKSFTRKLSATDKVEPTRTFEIASSKPCSSNAILTLHSSLTFLTPPLPCPGFNGDLCAPRQGSWYLTSTNAGRQGPSQRCCLKCVCTVHQLDIQTGVVRLLWLGPAVKLQKLRQVKRRESPEDEFLGVTRFRARELNWEPLAILSAAPPLSSTSGSGRRTGRHL